MVIRIENNLKEILQYLEVLNYTWNSGDKPTEYRPPCSCNCIVIENNHIAHDIRSEGMSFEEFKRQNPIKKEHIRPGMVIEYANGKRRLVTEINEELILVSNGNFLSLEEFNEDLTVDNESLVINKVGFPLSAASLYTMLVYTNFIWERPNPVTEITMEDIAEKFDIDVSQLRIKE